MFAVLLRYFKSLGSRIDRGLLYKLIFIALLIIIISAIIVFNVEPEGQFNNVFDASWWAIVTATTVGYGDFFPISYSGRIVAIILMFTGIGLFGGITATITEIFIKIEKRRELGQLQADYEGHIIICGWCDKTKEMVKQILSENIENKQIVLIANIESDPFPDNNLIHFIHGKIDEEESLNKASIKNAKTAIILNEDNNDATTVLSALTINSLNPDLYTIAEISKEENAVHLKNAGVDEIVINNNVNSRLMVRTAFYHGTSKVFNELLCNKVGNEIYMLEASEDTYEKNYKDMLNIIKEKNNATLLGLKRNGKILINPDFDEKIMKGDHFIYIARDRLLNII
ncbi:potassium channel family protein [Natronospora cellulosivora (SeqCode)]